MHTSPLNIPMRYYGTIIRWNEKRQFGAIREDATGAEIFAPLYAFDSDYVPAEGLRVSFDIAKGRRGRDEAQNIRPAAPDGDMPVRTLFTPNTPSRPRRSYTAPLTAMLVLACLAVAGWFGYGYWQDYRAAQLAEQNKVLVDEVADKMKSERRAWMNAVQNKPATAAPKAAQSKPSTTPSEKSQFTCDGRQHCSQMRSEEEARYFSRYCPNTEMDGDNDGIPCECGVGSENRCGDKGGRRSRR
ncbi:excalibur calcium-binding domain-containing protein [Neisseria perflava]|uniref:excalibur calcium-binding domain-containing protein n=1 Tax=Neisseria perflava TaxID=33053 RepID=UPI00209E1F09|nr:excalibur calcium-binding domain-containing protein [Neisseria perflava]MCP1659685.1 cold shock CspA family protein [Neisseria perflava]MCP1771295.1 cold shock CspA family protein [Neisseria perflava]